VPNWSSESSKLIPHCLILTPVVLCIDLIWRLLSLRLKILSTNLIILLATLFSPPCEICGSLKGKLFHATKENTELKQEVAYLIARLEKTKVSEKMIEDDLRRVEESATKSTYKLGVEFKRCENNGEKSAPKFIPYSNYHKGEEALK
jgi:predicted Zn-ribbon and HTH transcriptional regulator